MHGSGKANEMLKILPLWAVGNGIVEKRTELGKGWRDLVSDFSRL